MNASSMPVGTDSTWRATRLSPASLTHQPTHLGEMSVRRHTSPPHWLPPGSASSHDRRRVRPLWAVRRTLRDTPLYGRCDASPIWSL